MSYNFGLSDNDGGSVGDDGSMDSVDGVGNRGVDSVGNHGGGVGNNHGAVGNHGGVHGVGNHGGGVDSVGGHADSGAVAGLAGVGHVLDDAVAVVGVGDGLHAAVGQVDGVAAGGGVAVPLLLLGEVGAAVVVSHAVVVGVDRGLGQVAGGVASGGGGDHHSGGQSGGGGEEGGGADESLQEEKRSDAASSVGITRPLVTFMVQEWCLLYELF